MRAAGAITKGRRIRTYARIHAAPAFRLDPSRRGDTPCSLTTGPSRSYSSAALSRPSRNLLHFRSDMTFRMASQPPAIAMNSGFGPGIGSSTGSALTAAPPHGSRPFAPLTGSPTIRTATLGMSSCQHWVAVTPSLSVRHLAASGSASLASPRLASGGAGDALVAVSRDFSTSHCPVLS